jgi:hypothetical protein
LRVGLAGQGGLGGAWGHTHAAADNRKDNTRSNSSLQRVHQGLG